MDFYAERRRWEADQARMAPGPDAFDDEDQENRNGDSDFLPRPDSQHGSDFNVHDAPECSPEEAAAAEAEALLRREQEELDALVAMMEDDAADDDDTGLPPRHEAGGWQEESWGACTVPSHFGSDDEDYDGLFSQLVGGNDGVEHSAHGDGVARFGDGSAEGHDAMDVS